MQILTLAFLVGCTISAVLSAPAETYTSEFDHLDLDTILKNAKLVENYTKCLLDEGPCTREGRTLKSLLPDALKTACAKCTDRQKEGARKVIKFYMANHPENVKRFEQKYDPTGEFKDGLEKALLGSS